ncbi:MAG: NADH-quinone oxidoreductase subunit N [Polyangiales bacterium]
MNDLHTLWLPISVTALAVLVLLVDVLSPPSQSPNGGRRLGWLVALVLAALFLATFFVPDTGRTVSGYANGAWTTFVQRLFLAAGAIGTLGALDDVATHTPNRQGEYWLLLLSSLLGMILVAGARELILLVTSFELMGVPLYVLAAYAKTDAARVGDPPGKARAAEAALKLYLVGATSSAVTLFGLALLTGMTGTTHLAALASAPSSPLATLGMVFVLAGLGYKIGMVPFHMWVPDTYQGASTPFVAFLSVAPKAAGVAVLCSIFVMGLGSQRGLWMPPLALAALLSMAVGNLLALAQTDLRRVLGYSGIAQMGVLLVAIAAGDRASVSMTLFFLAAYVVTNLGAFLVVHVASDAGGGFGFDSLYGLWRRAPGLAAALLCFLLSLAGIPFVVGFWAKLYVFLAAWRAGLAGLVIAAIALTVLALFYYLQMLRAAYLVDESAPLPVPKPAPALRLAIGLCLVAVVGLGLYPRPLVEAAARAGDSLLIGAAR